MLETQHSRVFLVKRRPEVFPGIPGDEKSRDGTGNDGKRDGTGKQKKLISRIFLFFPVPSRPVTFFIIFLT
jgi:hypothetical protein